jgi:hypothetical protein
MPHGRENLDTLSQYQNLSRVDTVKRRKRRAPMLPQPEQLRLFPVLLIPELVPGLRGFS